MYRQHQHNHQKRPHHNLGDPLHTGFQAEKADRKTNHTHQYGPESHSWKIHKHSSESLCHLLLGSPGELTPKTPVAVIQHPSSNHGIEHHEQITPENPYVFQFSPPGRGGNQSLKAKSRALPAPPAHRKLADQYRYSQNQQECQIDQDKSSPPILSADIGKFPHIADAYGTSRRDQNETKTRSEFFSFHITPFVS